MRERFYWMIGFGLMALGSIGAVTMIFMLKLPLNVSAEETGPIGMVLIGLPWLGCLFCLTGLLKGISENLGNKGKQE